MLLVLQKAPFEPIQDIILLVDLIGKMDFLVAITFMRSVSELLIPQNDAFLVLHRDKEVLKPRLFFSSPRESMPFTLMRKLLYVPYAILQKHAKELSLHCLAVVS